MNNLLLLVAPLTVLGAAVLSFMYYVSNQESHQYENYNGSGYAHRFRSNDDAQWSRSNDNASQRPDEGSLLNIKRKKKKNDCVVCNEPLLHENVEELSCGHKFHRNCTTEWFKQYEQCPLCWSES